MSVQTDISFSDRVLQSRLLDGETVERARASVGGDEDALPSYLIREGLLMNVDHKKAVKAFEKAANEAKDADVKAFAAKTLPTLKEHLSMAEDLQKKVGK